MLSVTGDIDIGYSNTKRGYACLVFPVRYRCSCKANVFNAIYLAGLLFCTHARATTIVALWTPDHLVIAADTSVSNEHNRRVGTACKIRSEGRMVFAAAGLFQHPITGFDMPSVVHTAYENARSDGEESLDWINTQITIGVTKGLDAAKASVSEILARDPSLNWAEIITAIANPDGVKVMLMRSYASDATKQGRFSKERNPKGLVFVSERAIIPQGPQRIQMIAAGSADHILRYQMMHPEWLNEDPIKAARMFVQMEIDAHPGLVGGPIAILVIDKSGKREWIEHGACPAQVK